ncbi:MAG: hypothetical protein ACLFVW_06580 [Phycisphaerae bacterium]
MTAAAVGDLSYVVWLAVVCGLLMLLCLAAYVLIVFLRRRAYEDHEPTGPAFTPEGLESMRRSGRLTEEEYRRLRRQVLGIDVGMSGGSSSSSPPARDDGQTDPRNSSPDNNEEQ